MIGNSCVYLKHHINGVCNYRSLTEYLEKRFASFLQLLLYSVAGGCCDCNNVDNLTYICTNVMYAFQVQIVTRVPNGMCLQFQGKCLLECHATRLLRLGVSVPASGEEICVN